MADDNTISTPIVDIDAKIAEVLTAIETTKTQIADATLRLDNLAAILLALQTDKDAAEKARQEEAKKLSEEQASAEEANRQIESLDRIVLAESVPEVSEVPAPDAVEVAADAAPFPIPITAEPASNFPDKLFLESLDSLASRVLAVETRLGLV